MVKKRKCLKLSINCFIEGRLEKNVKKFKDCGILVLDERSVQSMSQEKVDRYKEQKRNRKAIQAKKKRNSLIAKGCTGLLVLALGAWLGYSAVDSYVTKQNSEPVTADITALNEYSMSLSEE